MNVWIITGAFLLLATLQPLPDSFGEPKFLSMTDPSTNLSFTFPRSFHLVRYADDPDYNSLNLAPPSTRYSSSRNFKRPFSAIRCTSYQPIRGPFTSKSSTI